MMTPLIKEPKASPAKVAYHLRQLRKLFSRASDPTFLQMVWAIDALRSGRPEIAASLLTFPQQAADQSMGSRFAIHQWELETLLIQFFSTPREEPQLGSTAVFDCNNFESVAGLVNRLRKLEDVESAVYLRSGGLNIFGEMHRLAQRQFHWQRGYLNTPQFYRYAFMYAQGKCGEYFEKTYGVPITDLNFVGFALFAQSMRAPWISRTFTVPELKFTTDLMKRALPLLLSLCGARASGNQQNPRWREHEARTADPYCLPTEHPSTLSARMPKRRGERVHRAHARGAPDASDCRPLLRPHPRRAGAIE
jgi:hypothetical protein